MLVATAAEVRDDTRDSFSEKNGSADKLGGSDHSRERESLITTSCPSEE